MKHGIPRVVRFAFTAALLVVSGSVGAQSRIPSRLSDADFWFLSQSLSEPSGYFQSENYVSNEQEMQNVIPRFASISPAARGVYLGVGPEQNYTYIAAMRPQIAFILDIRRGNLLEHLLYKAIFELSEDRVDFMSRLFSKPRPSTLTRNSSVDSIAGRFWDVFGDSALFLRNRQAIFDVLLKRHALPLTTADTQQLGTIYHTFFSAGLGLHYSFPGANTRNDATFYDIIVGADTNGVQRGFLASDTAFRFVKDMHERNLIVPVVGDFAGPKALREIGKWVRERGATVGAFYVSNVEQYLFQNDRWGPFYDNVATLPIHSTSTFVRSIANTSYSITVRAQRIVYYIDSGMVVNGGQVGGYGGTTMVSRDNRPGFRSVTSLISHTLSQYRNGAILGYPSLTLISR